MAWLYEIYNTPVLKWWIYIRLYLYQYLGLMQISVLFIVFYHKKFLNFDIIDI